MTETFQRWEQEAREPKRLATQVVLMAMKAHNVKCVVCEYSGVGDSGCIEETHVLKEPVEPEDFHTFDVELDEEGRAALEAATTGDIELTGELDTLFKNAWEKPTTLLDMITYAADYVTPMGYENNDGGQGTIVFDAVNNECRCEHGSNYTETSYDSETISFEEGGDAEVQS